MVKIKRDVKERGGVTEKKKKKKKKRKSPPTFTASDFYVEVRTYVVVLFTHYK